MIREAYAAFIAGDLEKLREAFHPDAEYVNPPEAIEGGTRRGEAELMTTWRNVHDLFELHGVEMNEIRECPAGVFALVRFQGRGRSSGVPIDIQQYHVIAMRDGRIARLAWFVERDDALAAAGL
jgi:ketosteroid isomerase-like protein